MHKTITITIPIVPIIVKVCITDIFSHQIYFACREFILHSEFIALRSVFVRSGSLSSYFIYSTSDKTISPKFTMLITYMKED